MALSRSASILPLALVVALSGCTSVTTKITGTPRAGAEQLLLTGTSDRAVSSIDFRPLAGHNVFLDATQVSAADSGWVIFSLRREMTRQGILLVRDKKDAQTIVAAAVAAYGTDEVDCRISLPTSISLAFLPISTIATDASGLIRKNRQGAVVKLALFAYDAKTKHHFWDSGTVMQFGQLDRRYFGSANVSCYSSLPELECYPPHRVR